MKFKKIMILLIMAVFLVSIASVCATDANDTMVASEDTSQIELSVNEEMSMDNLQTSEEKLESGVDDESFSDKTDTELLGEAPATYSDLAEEINKPGNVTLTHKNYVYADGATPIVIDEDNKVIDGNGAVIDMAGSTIRAFKVSPYLSVTIKNLTIKNAKCSGNGGAIYFDPNFSQGTVENCNFVNNSATADGGAVYINSGIVINCNFTDNSAAGSGGAIYFTSIGGNYEVKNCNFINNTALCNGSAIYFLENGGVTNCNFINNTALVNGSPIFSMRWFTTADTCIFKRNSGENVNTVISPPTLNVDNFTTVYGSGEKLTFNLTTDSGIQINNGKISISVYFKDNNSWVGNYSCLSGEGWTVSLPVGSYYANFDTEYDGFDAINRTIKVVPDAQFYVKVTPVTTHNKTVNITTKSNIPQDIIKGKLLFILPNDENITANYVGNGTWWIVHRFDDYGDYPVKASYIGFDNVNVDNATIIVCKISTLLIVDDVTATYNINRNLVITLKDDEGNVLSGASVTVKLNEEMQYSTDAQGQIKVNVAKLAPKIYVAIMTYNGDDIYAGSIMKVLVNIKKAKPKFVAKKKTFKKSKKVKKYSVVLKDNLGNAIKKASVSIKVGKKTFKAKTNSKGKVTFKIKKLAKKAKYNAKVTFNGDKYYCKVTKKVKITIK